MKPGPVIAMVLLVFLGMWLVMQPALRKSKSDLVVRVGAVEILLQRSEFNGKAGYRVLAPESLRTGSQIGRDELDEFLTEQMVAWNERPAWARNLLGFFNITSWGTFGWVAIGLLGQAAFFGRMLVQWIVSERTHVSTVPVAFWWMSLLGGICLFTYFVWRVDIVGVLGQSTGVVIYARNLRLIHEEKRRNESEVPDEANGTESADRVESAPAV